MAKQTTNSTRRSKVAKTTKKSVSKSASQTSS